MGNRERGETPLADGDRITWTREHASGAEVSVARARATALIFRVRTLRPCPGGTGIVTTYGVPGAWLDTWLAELRGRGDEAETVLSVEAV